MHTQTKSQRRLVSTGLLVALTIFGSAAPSFAGGGWGQQHPRRAEVLGRDNREMNRINNDRGNLSGHYNQLHAEDQGIRAQEQAEARANGGYLTRGEQRQLNHEENGLNRQIRQDHNPYQQMGNGYGGGYPGGGFPNHPGYPGGGFPNHPGGVMPVGYPGGGLGAGGVPGAPVVSPGIPGAGFPGGNFTANHPRRAEVLGRDNGLNQEINADHGNLSGNYRHLEHEDNAIRHQEQADARANGGFITQGQQAQLNREENHVQNQINRDFR